MPAFEVLGRMGTETLKASGRAGQHSTILPGRLTIMRTEHWGLQNLRSVKRTAWLGHTAPTIHLLQSARQQALGLWNKSQAAVVFSFIIGTSRTTSWVPSHHPGTTQMLLDANPFAGGVDLIQCRRILPPGGQRGADAHSSPDP